MDVYKKLINVRTDDINIIEEIKSKDSEEVKKEDIQDISEPKIILSYECDSSSFGGSLKSINKKVLTLIIKF